MLLLCPALLLNHTLPEQRTDCVRSVTAFLQQQDNVLANFWVPVAAALLLCPCNAAPVRSRPFHHSHSSRQ